MIGSAPRHLSLWRALAALLVVAALAASPVAADPGRPGVGNAAQVVYPNVAGEENAGDLNPGAVLPAEEVAAGGAGDDGGSLPFTGFPAVLILGVGLGALLLGAVARRHTRS